MTSRPVPLHRHGTRPRANGRSALGTMAPSQATLATEPRPGDLRSWPAWRRALLLLSAAVLVAVWSHGGLGQAFAAGPEASVSSSTAAGVLLALLLASIGLGLPLFVIIGVLGLAAYAVFAPDFQGINSWGELPREMARLVGKTELLAIPFFVASGAIMSAGGIARRLNAFATALVGWMPGGIAVATIGGCVFFAAISGSSPVTVIAIGSMMYPELLRKGYDRRFSLGLLSSAGSLGILIPPSIPMLIYAIVASGKRAIDVTELFMAGILPGLLIAGLLTAYSMYATWGLPRGKFSWSELVRTTRDGVWAIGLPVVILGGIYGGIFTTTEAAAVSVVYALVVELLIHRDISVRDLPGVLGEACVSMGTILVIMAFSVFLNLFLVEQEVPNEAVRMIRGMNLGPLGFLLIVNVFLLIIGAFMDAISAILIIAPLLAPIGLQLGIDPVHLGIIFIVNLEIGYLTPPIGINLFVASSVFKQPVGEVVRGVVPFVCAMLIGLGVITYVPSVSLGLVNVFMRDKPFVEGFAAPVDPAQPGAGGEGEEVVAPPDGYVGPTGERVLSVEELMEANTDDSLADDDDDDD